MAKIISVASWEPRFYLGLNEILRENKFEYSLVYFYDYYSSRTKHFRDNLRSEFSSSYNEIELPFLDPLAAWKLIRTSLVKFCSKNDDVVFDITTAPRDAIYYILYMLRDLKCNVTFIYHRPEGYGDWLSRDSDKPELLFKMSGIFSLSKPTLLLFMPGYDAERMQQLIVRHEPQKILLGLQEGTQYDSIERCRNGSRATIELLHLTADYFDYDAYSEDQGFSSIEESILPYITEYNVLAGALGPKPSSIALFHLYQKYPKIGLLYVRSRDYNKDYSNGFSSRVTGEVHFLETSLQCANAPEAICS